MKSSWILLVLSLLVGCGKGEVYLSDDIDLVLDFSPLSVPSDELHSPYVRGTQVIIYINPGGRKESMERWELRSSRPEVLRIDQRMVSFSESQGEQRARVSARCTALGEGQADLIALDQDGREVHRATVEVFAPDRVELLAHGPLLIGRSEDEAVVAEARVLRGGTATFLARYFRGPRRLHGNGVLAAQAPAMITASPQQSFLFENREWLSITPASNAPPAESQVPLSASGVEVARLRVITVTEEDIRRIELAGSDESRARDREWLVLLAQAYDSAARPIYGVEYDWTLAGQAQAGKGDLFRYEFIKGGMRQMITARHQTLGASAMIQAGEGRVSSTKFIGCSAAPGGTGVPGTGAALLIMLMVLARRRSRPA